MEAQNEILGYRSVVGDAQGEIRRLVQITGCRRDVREKVTCRLAMPGIVGPASDGLVDLDDGTAAYLDSRRDLDVREGFVADLLGEGKDVAIGKGHECGLLEKLPVRSEEAGTDVDCKGAAGEFVNHDAGLRWKVEECGFAECK